MKKSIFKTLIENNICFSVCISISTFKIKGISNNSKDYFIALMSKDTESIKEFYFKNSSNKLISEYDLSNREINEFKSNLNKYDKILHNEYGRVYELKNNSFKDYYNEVKDSENDALEYM